MMIKEINKTVHLAWSPKSQYPIYLVAGTAAQQLDASFNTSASVELYKVDLTDPSIDLQVQCAFKSDYRFHKLVWGDECGKIVGGCDSGVLSIYDANRLVESQSIDYENTPTTDNALVTCLKAHSGPIRALDFNLQKNLLASGASSSELFIWDLNRELVPMKPPAEIQHSEDIVSLSCNKQVQHIIASAFPTQCLVWDLRTFQPIIKLSDSTSKVRWKDVKWNPENGSQHATQLCLASEDDQYPVIQMWDLRLASSPIKVFEGHQKGVLSLSWSDADPDMLISCGKDDKLLLWNPNTSSANGEVTREIPLSTEWNYEVNWSPRNPFLISSSSCNGRATITTLASDDTRRQTDKIADSFPGVNQYQQFPPKGLINLAKAPKWIKRTSGVSFGFGGKLLSFGCENSTVQIQQVVTEPDLSEKFKQLEEVLEGGNVYVHCVNKSQMVDDPDIKDAWNFLAGQFFGDEFKNHVQILLDNTNTILQEKLRTLNITPDLSEDPSSSEPFSNAARIGPADDDIFNVIATKQNLVSGSSTEKKSTLKIPQSDDVEGAITDALLLGNLELAVNLCLKEDKIADALILAISSGPELVAKAQSKYFQKNQTPITTLISAIVTNDWTDIVETCDISDWKQVLVALLTYTRDSELRNLCESLGRRLSTEGDETFRRNALICFICAGNANELIKHWKPLRSGSATEIQELAELALVSREAFKARNIEVPVAGVVSEALLRYAQLLASEGYLKEAYSYLGESTEENIEELKDRVMIALGLKSTHQDASFGYANGYTHTQHPHQTPRTNQHDSRGHPPITRDFTSNSTPSFNRSAAPMPSLYSNAPPTTFSTPKPPPTIPPVPPIPSFAQYPQRDPIPAPIFTPAPVTNPPPAGPPSFVTSHQPFTSTFQPQRPPSTPFTNSAPGSQFNQYNAPANPTPTPPPPSSQTPYNNARHTPDGISHSKSKYLVDPSVKGATPSNTFSSYTPSIAPITHQPMHSSVPSFAPQNGAFPVPQHNTNFYSGHPPQQIPNSYNANEYSGFLQQSVQSEVPKMSTGWNNPLGSNQQPIQASSTPNPVTYPMYGSAPRAESIPAPSTFNTLITSEGDKSSNSYQNNVITKPSTKQSVASKPKPVLPEQHIEIQTILENLRDQCINKTANFQMKRKLDDMSRRLETLYDAIINSKLSTKTLQGLHDIVKAIQNGNYAECLSIHTQIVSGPDFSNVAGFMPGIKVLVQSAMQLDVHL